MSRKLSPELYSAQRKFFARRPADRVAATSLPDSVVAYVAAVRAAQKGTAPAAAPTRG